MASDLSVARITEIINTANKHAQDSGFPLKWNGKAITCLDYANEAVTSAFNTKWLPIIVARISDDVVAKAVDTLATMDDRHLSVVLHSIATQDPTAGKVFLFSLVVHFCNGRTGNGMQKMLAASGFKYPLMEVVISVCKGLPANTLPQAGVANQPTKNYDEGLAILSGAGKRNTTISGDEILCGLAKVPGISHLFWASAHAYVQTSSAFGIALACGIVTGGNQAELLLIDSGKMEKLFPGSPAGIKVAWIHTFNLLMIGGRNGAKMNLRKDRAQIRMLHNQMKTSESAKEAIRNCNGPELDKAMGFEGYPVLNTVDNPYDSIAFRTDGEHAAKMTTTVPGAASTTSAASFSEPNTADFPTFKKTGGDKDVVRMVKLKAKLISIGMGSLDTVGLAPEDIEAIIQDEQNRLALQ